MARTSRRGCSAFHAASQTPNVPDNVFLNVTNSFSRTAELRLTAINRGIRHMKWLHLLTTSICCLIAGCYGDAAFEISGTVTNTDAIPIEGVEISVSDMTGVLDLTVLKSGTNGEFQLLKMYPGKPIKSRQIRVRCSKHGYSPLEFLATMEDTDNTFTFILHAVDEN